MPRGGTLGYRGGWGAKIFFFPKFSQIWCRIIRERGDLRWRAIECVLVENYFSYFSTKTYVVGPQKNRHNETVLLSTQNTCLNGWVRKKFQFKGQKHSLSGPMNRLEIYSVRSNNQETWNHHYSYM